MGANSTLGRVLFDVAWAKEAPLRRQRGEREQNRRPRGSAGTDQLMFIHRSWTNGDSCSTQRYLCAQQESGWRTWRRENADLSQVIYLGWRRKPLRTCGCLCRRGCDHQTQRPGSTRHTYLGGQGSVLQAWLIAGGRWTVSHKVSLTVCWVWVCKHTAMASWWPGGWREKKNANDIE